MLSLRAIKRNCSSFNVLIGSARSLSSYPFHLSRNEDTAITSSKGWHFHLIKLEPRRPPLAPSSGHMFPQMGFTSVITKPRWTQLTWKPGNSLAKTLVYAFTAAFDTLQACISSGHHWFSAFPLWNLQGTVSPTHQFFLSWGHPHCSTLLLSCCWVCTEIDEFDQCLEVVQANPLII